jgi:hypothetical protein
VILLRIENNYCSQDITFTNCATSTNLSSNFSEDLSTTKNYRKHRN